jgi:hypothetical protein
MVFNTRADLNQRLSTPLTGLDRGKIDNKTEHVDDLARIALMPLGTHTSLRVNNSAFMAETDKMEDPLNFLYTHSALVGKSQNPIWAALSLALNTRGSVWTMS